MQIVTNYIHIVTCIFDRRVTALYSYCILTNRSVGRACALRSVTATLVLRGPRFGIVVYYKSCEPLLSPSAKAWFCGGEARIYFVYPGAFHLPRRGCVRKSTGKKDTRTKITVL